MPVAFKRPFRPAEIGPSTLEQFPLAEMAAKLKIEPAFVKSGRNSLSLARCDDLTVVLVVLKKGAALKEHKAPGAATVVLLDGAIDFERSKDGKKTRLAPQDTVVFSADLQHAVEARQDSTFLVVIGGKMGSEE